MRTIWTGILLGSVTAALGLAAYEGPGSPINNDERIPFPESYRTWAHVKSTIIGPENPGFANNGGLHHFYANPAAMEGYRTGKFADGAILIDDLVELKADGTGVSREGARRRVAVMLKDSGRFATTGGWGFEIFKADTKEGSLNADGRNACFACHQKAEHSVFSSYRP
jgi:hypothetical protein